MEGHLLAPLLEDPDPAPCSWPCWSRAAHAAGGRGCDRPLPPARRNPRRRRGRGLRQDRQDDGPAVSRRPAAAALGGAGPAWRVPILAADDRPPRPGFQLQRPEDAGPARVARLQRRRDAPTSRGSRTRWSTRSPSCHRAGRGRLRHAGRRRRRAPTRRCAPAGDRRQARRSRALPASFAVHRQRRDDRLRRGAAPGGRPRAREVTVQPRWDMASLPAVTSPAAA